MIGDMDKDLLQAIRIIDDKIASLQEARNRLASAFGVVTPSATTTAARTTPIPARHRNAPAVDQNADGHPAPRGRKDELAEFLRTNGPMSRVAIVEKSGLPEGTVSYCLSDKRFFEQIDGGDWNITEFSRRGLEHRLPSLSEDGH